MEFPHLTALLPEIKAADERFQHQLETFRNSDDLHEIARQYNEVLEKAAEALYLDTKHVNSRDTIRRVFLRIPEGGLTYFSNSPYLRLKTVVDTGSIARL